MQNLIPLLGLQATIHTYGYPIFFFLAIVEGPIATVTASFLASAGFFNVFAVFLISAVGDVIGDLIYYHIGFFGQRKFLNKEKFLGFSSQKILKVREYFENHGGKTILLGKVTHGVGFTVLIAAGVAEMPLSRFIFYTTLGTIPKSLFFAALGFYFGKAYAHIDNFLSYLGLIIFATISLLLLYLLMNRFRAFFQKNY